MKKIALMLMIVILGTTAFAAAASKKTASSMGAGVDVTLLGGMPYWRFVLDSDRAVDAGLGYTSTSVGGATTSGFTIFGRYENLLNQVTKELKTNWGASLMINSASAAGATTTTFTLAGLLGAEYSITSNLSLYGYVTVLSFSSASTGGTSTTTIALLSGSPTSYTGFRIYL